MADCIKIQLEQFHCEKIDILSYGYGKFENFISSVYLQWIHKLPELYSSIYRAAAVENPMLNKRFRTYEFLFIKVLRNVLEEKKPDFIICTHALPSYLVARLKKLQLWTGLGINIYTDYFVNNLWGIEGIDYHFVPSKEIKDFLVRQGVDEKKILITGIPVHPIFNRKKHIVNDNSLYSALISGGNMGAGSILKLLNHLRPGGQILYRVLCGKNEKLLGHIKKMNHPFIKPIPYISSKDEMNRLYDEAHLIITKPGGVTISESLTKKIPIFVYDALPGQEEQNMNFLKKNGLVHHLDGWTIREDMEEEILTVLCHKKQEMITKINRYLMEIELKDPVPFINNIIKDVDVN